MLVGCQIIFFLVFVFNNKQTELTFKKYLHRIRLKICKYIFLDSWFENTTYETTEIKVNVMTFLSISLEECMPSFIDFYLTLYVFIKVIELKFGRFT